MARLMALSPDSRPRAVGSRPIDREGELATALPTRAGGAVLEHFDRARVELDEATKLEQVRGPAGTLRVGVEDSVAARLVSATLRVLARRQPDLAVRTDASRSPDGLAQAVRDGHLELALGSPPLRRGPFSFEPLLRDPYVLLVPADWPIARSKDPAPLDELLDLPLIDPGDQRVASALDVACCDRGRHKPRYAGVAGADGPVQALVAARVGAAILPQLAVDPHRGRVKVLDLDEPLPPRQIVLYARAGAVSTAAIEAFVDAALRACCPGRIRPSAVVPVADSA